MIENVNREEPLFFDLETQGLYGEILLASFYQKGWPEAIVIERPNSYDLLSFLIDKYIIGHNIHYDISTIQAQTKTNFIPYKFDDTFIAAKLRWPAKENFDLESVCLYALGLKPYESNKKDLQKSFKKGLYSQEQIEYAKKDTYYLAPIWEKCKTVTDSFVYKQDIRTLKIALNFQNNGLYLDINKSFEYLSLNKEKVQKINLPINPNSYIQVRPYIKSEESDDLALAKLALQGNEKAEQVRIVRKLLKENSFIQKFLDSCDNDNKIYGKFSPKTRSGRFASFDQNLQQIPRNLKKLFSVPEGHVIIYSDFSQLELRTIAAITGDKIMCQLFKEGIDLHGYTAELLFGKDWTKRERQIAKTFNFSLLYGAGVGVAKSRLIKDANIWLTEDEIRDKKQKWHNLYSGITAWQEQGKSAWRHQQLWSTPCGRKYLGARLTDQLNIMNQGFGAEISKLALIYIDEILQDSEFELNNYIHDSFYITGPDKPAEYKEVAKKVGECMQRAWQELVNGTEVKAKDIPMPVNVRVGYNWGDIESDKFVWEINL